MTARGRINENDPSRLRATEDRRARMSDRAISAAIQSAVNRVQDGNITDPKVIASIVSEELDKYKRTTVSEYATWTNDTVQRSILRAEQLLKAEGVKIDATLGPRPITPQLRDSLIVNVESQIDSLTADTKARVTNALIESVNNGEGARDSARRISDATMMPRNRAMLIARTETMRAYNKVNQDQFNKYGVAKVQWLAAKDERTCDVCGARDGKQYPVDDHPDIPAHPQCRCILTPVVPEI